MSQGAAPDPLDSSVAVLRGVGPDRRELLARLGIRTVRDLLLHRPRRYEDRRTCRRIAELEKGETAATQGRIVAQGLKRFRRRRQSLFELILDDGTGRLHCRWWNLPFMENYFHVGQEVFVFGRVRDVKPRTMDHPETEVIEDGEADESREGGEGDSIHLHRIVPVYPATEGVTQRWLRWLTWQALERFGESLTEPHSGTPWPDHLPAHAEAIRQLHFPDETESAERARERLALEEFVELQLGIQRRRRNLESHGAGLPCAGDNRLIHRFLSALPFRLTDAQTRVLRELRRDLAGAHPMRRLLQGDVGSGKTVVAAAAALMTVESGFEVAYMAPTEVLARQQWRTLRDWFEPLGVPVGLRTGKAVRDPGASLFDEPGTSSVRKERLPTVTVGTHALIEAGFNPDRLGLVIIDEQHKFGVAQRERLVRKGRYPHLLVMTATPIPRTLGLTLYGDLDVSVIDALPAARGRLRTHVRTEASLPRVWAFVRDELARGRQAYIVYPRVEESDLKSGLKAVLKEHQRLVEQLAPHQVGLLHGRLGPDEKEAVMQEFRKGRTPALVATSIIEVGLDVPQATVMVVENAERFGLAQLHQLRGRIGRGADDAHCILVAGARTKEARERLKVLAETDDGFAIAEADLKLRGPGELLGQSQSGLPPFRFGNLATDLRLIEQAREIATRILDTEGTPTSRPAN